MALSERWGEKYKKAQSYTTLLLHLGCKNHLGTCQAIKLGLRVLSSVPCSSRWLCSYGSSPLFAFFFFFFSALEAGDPESITVSPEADKDCCE